MQWFKRNRPLVRHISILMASITVGSVLYVLLVHISGILTIHNFNSNLPGQVQFLLLKICLPWLLLSPLATVIAIKVPLSPDRWMSPALMHLGLFLTLSLVHGLAISYTYHYFEDMAPNMRGYQAWQHTGHFLFGNSLFLIDMIIYTLFIASFNLKNFYAIAQQKQLDSAKLNQQLTQSKLEALRMQVNPHFLFNTLNVISVLVLKNANEQAGQMIERLSCFFRQTLNDNHQKMLPLERELDMIQNYLAIEQVRFGDRLKVTIKCDKEVKSMLVPNMILQPLVENAMQHGLGQKEGKGTLSIICHCDDNYLYLQIQDDGVGYNALHFDNQKSAGIGINNVKERLQQIYGNKHKFDIKGAESKGVTVSLVLPKQKA